MKKTFFKKALSVLLSFTLLMPYLPQASLTAQAATTSNAVADPGTAYTWETMMGLEADGNRYAGRVWADKSVYTDGETAVLNTKGTADSSFEVSLADDEAFQVIFSALGSSMTTTEKSSTSGPLDVVLILDTSTSMDTGNVTRLQKVIEAANVLIDDLLSISGVRISIVTYNVDSETVLPLTSYDNGLDLVVTNYSSSNRNNYGVVYAYDDDGKLLGNDDGYGGYTNLQSGIDRGFNVLATETTTEGRSPVAIVLTDGQANLAVKSSFYDVQGKTPSNVTDERLILSTLLNAAYNKAKVEANYEKDLKVYSISIDLDEDDKAHAIMNPGDTEHGFNSNNRYSDVRNAYEDYYLDWADGDTVNIGWLFDVWTFDHNYPKPNGLTRQDIVDNINYVDTYMNVTSASLGETFEQIGSELISAAFNPISSTVTTDGGTGVRNTPLIYVDNIGKYMEVKEIQAITLFGASYAVIKNNDGTYTVSPATGTNPTTNEAWNTSEDILISVTDNADETQKLEVKINQEILPISLEQVNAQTVGEVTTATLAELTYSPLRVYYTVGIDSDILLPNGSVNVSKIDPAYPYIDEVTGQITFYSNSFGQINTTDSDSDGLIDIGDAHIGFKPSLENRYYYHPANQGIFSNATRVDGTPISWDASEYGVLYEEGAYDLTYLTYADYDSMQDDDEVYTYVTFYRPTPSITDAATTAERVTYLVFTNWGYLKESVAFYDAAAGVFINYDETTGTYTTSDEAGYVMPEDKIATTIQAYMNANGNADIKAMLGKQSLRSSRLHNMQVDKSSNDTLTAERYFDPDYTYDTSDIHNGNDVVIWLGNNGRLTTGIDTGIKLTKNVTEAIGNADDTYAITVTIPDGVTATPKVMAADGSDITATISTYANNVLTVNLKAGETVYINGIPEGTICAIDEVIPATAEYSVAAKTDTVTVPTAQEVLNGAAQFAPAYVTNTPEKYGTLYVTKNITSAIVNNVQHMIPDSIMEQAFEVVVHFGQALAGQTLDIETIDPLDSTDVTTSQITLDANGDAILSLKAAETVAFTNIPTGTVVTVSENLTTTQANVFDMVVAYTSDDTAVDATNSVTITAGSTATAVVTNVYAPQSTTVDLDISGTKIFSVEGEHAGGSFNFKVQKWNGTAWEDISGKTATVTYEANASGTRNFTIEDVLAGITYDSVGSWAYQVLEVKGTTENVTFDRTLYTFTVTVEDVDGQLVATVTDLNSTPITNGVYSVTFENTYHTAPVSIDIVKDVINQSGDTAISKAGFNFTAVQTDATWAPLTGADASTLTVSSDAAGEARVTATYKEAGTYYYVLTEAATPQNGWAHSNAEYHITVTVTQDPTTGNLVASLDIQALNTANGESAGFVENDTTKGIVSFVNTYNPDDTSLSLNTMVKKTLSGTGKQLANDMFTFYIYADGSTTPILTGTNAADGTVSFNDVLAFDTVGSYKYDIVEMIPNGAVLDSVTQKYTLNGMTYDATVYDLVVNVRNNNSTGKLEIANYYFENSTSQTVSFNNSYDATPTSYTIRGTKNLIGRAPKVGEFSFALYEGNNLLETVTNTTSTGFSFTALDFDTVGSYTYTVKEVLPDEADRVPGVTYTGASHDITVTITIADNNGALEVSSVLVQDAAGTDLNSNIAFENTYAATPATVSFSGRKDFVNANLNNNYFNFALYETDFTFNIAGKTAAQIKGNVGNTFAFDALTFDTPGIYFYTIVEDSWTNPMDEVLYDSSQHNYRIIVTDDGNGQLTATVLYVNANVTSSGVAVTVPDVTFINAPFDEVTEKEVYLDEDTVTQIDGSRVKEGDILTYFITYTNYNGETVEVIITDVIPNHTEYVDGSASHNGTYAGTHLSWILNVDKGESVTVNFKVKVTETNSVVANVAEIRDGKNIYYTNEVTNHSIDEIVEKDVFLAHDMNVSIDGKAVDKGNELVYTISYTNATNGMVDLTITDDIPRYTTYVDGSADNGGVYQNGTITWEIKDVPAWETVTVAFKVRVNTNIGAVGFTNKANVFDGFNNYETNEVVNYIPHAKGDDPNPTPAPTPGPGNIPEGDGSPKTGDNANLPLWIAIMSLSGIGILVTMLFGKKKKEDA